jgi:phospholipid/cholesterol/gamma-HCH transport system substrate-binding protein
VKAFTERNPKRLGAVILTVMAVIIAAVIFLNKSVFQSGYPIEARFSNAAGIGKGAAVLMAGVNIGTVSSVKIDGNSVLADMTINDGVVLPRHTTAAIEVETLLGVVDVSLQPVSGWSDPLRSGALLTDTSVPTEFYQLQNTAGKLLQQTNATALNNLVESLASITQGKQVQVAEIINGLGKLTTTVDQRSSQVSQLIDSANTVSSTLAGSDQQLVSVIDNLNTVAAGLADHSSDLANLIDNTDSMAAQTSDLIGQNQPQLNNLLQNLHSVLGVVGQHQDDLAEGLSYLASATRGFASVGYSGPNDSPNNWANVYTNPAGLTSTYGVIGPCGALDQALNQILGPDPLPCDEQTGPLPGSSSSTPSSASGSGGTASSSTSAAPGTSATSSSAGSAGDASDETGPNAGLGGLTQLFTPLVGGGP